ncbi:MAG: NAD(P)/FAD-dependent oxidoreductase [Clostridia bacterium]|nr:NAD(P)/FAD-dependent oxidoreductase [Clostridia bacterium]
MKIAIIGGGPAGLSAAKIAAKNGLSVTIFERYKIGERINCAEGFFDFLGICGKPEAGVLFPVKNIQLKIKSLHHIDSSELNLWIIDRQKWQSHMAKQLHEMSVEIFEETPINTENLEGLKKDFDWLIDASGVSALAMKSHGDRDQYRGQHALTLQYKLEGDFSKYKNSLKAGLGPHFHGYYWIFPKSTSVNGAANVGIGTFNPTSRGINLKEELSRVLEEENLRHYTVLERRGGRIPFHPATPFLRDNVLLVGDTAGLASPLHGGGLDMALLSGKMAAQSLIKGKPQTYERLFLRKTRYKMAYERKIHELWGELGIDFMERSIKTALFFGQRNFRRGLLRALKSTIKI